MARMALSSQEGAELTGESRAAKRAPRSLKSAECPEGRWMTRMAVNSPDGAEWLGRRGARRSSQESSE